MIAEPMNPETRRQFDRWLWRERISRIIDLGLPVGVGITLFVGMFWLRSHGGPAWIGLAIAAVAALAKPTLMVIRVVEKRRCQKKMD